MSINATTHDGGNKRGLSVRWVESREVLKCFFLSPSLGCRRGRQRARGKIHWRRVGDSINTEKGGGGEEGKRGGSLRF